MNKINFVAVVAAFFAMCAADWLITQFVCNAMAYGSLTPEMSDEERRELAKAITGRTDFILWIMFLGTGTTIGAGYLAARIAKAFPYYNGLAVGIACIGLTVLAWSANPFWLSLLALLSAIPASVYGAHIAKRHMAAVQ